MRLAALVFALCSILAAVPAAAQAPGTMSYQGVLTDGAGQLVPDGSYDLTFRIYDVASGGAALWSEAHPGVAVVRGGFGLTLGTAAPLSLAFDRRYYLGIQVFADPEMTPRVELTSSPYALSLRLPFTQTLSSASPLLSLENTGAGPDARFLLDIEIGGAATNGEARLYRSGASPYVGRLYTTSAGGNLDLRDEAGNFTVANEADVSGSGGFFAVYRSTGAQGFTVDGNAGSNEPLVTIAGSARSAVFQMGASDNPSVQLPANAIAAAEVLDEPGVASDNATTIVAMDGTVQVLLSRTITVPAAGYCLVLGTLEAIASHANGTQDLAEFGVSDDAALPGTQDVALVVASAAPTGPYYHPVTVQAVFPVAAGANTFNLLGREFMGTCSFGDRQLSVLYVPTSYGTVTAPAPAEAGGDAPTGAALTAADLAREKDEARAFHLARLERELAEAREQLARVQRDLQAAADAQAQAAGATKP